MTAPQCNWPLPDGSVISFGIFAENKNWNPLPGLYIFTYQLQEGPWHPLYVGKTGNFAVRPATHERLADAVTLGATHIHAKVVHDAKERELLEEALIRHLQPVMNLHHRY